jgi:2-keto-3-deoxy-L-rhamnonate aldolase RhmA
MANRLKTLLESGQPAIGSWVTFADPYSVELMADAGFDWLLIDTEHIPISREVLRTILIAMKGSISAPIVRLPSNSLDHFQTALDLGAQGVVVPMISSREDADQAVRCCRYPPLGARGFAPVRASRYFQDLDAYASQANDQISLIVQIETPEAVANIDRILETESVNGIFIGPSDLASFMGLPAQTGHPDVVQVVDRLIKSAHAHSMPFGLPTWATEECLSYVQRGGQLLTLGSDLHYLASSVRSNLSGMRKLLQEELALTCGRITTRVDGAK